MQRQLRNSARASKNNNGRCDETFTTTTSAAAAAAAAAALLARDLATILSLPAEDDSTEGMPTAG
ncbi:hypothetical protein VTH82DRAFT_3497 [Thermothelomyces myriococcoides]